MRTPHLSKQEERDCNSSCKLWQKGNPTCIICPCIMPIFRFCSCRGIICMERNDSELLEQPLPDPDRAQAARALLACPALQQPARLPWACQVKTNCRIQLFFFPFYFLEWKMKHLPLSKHFLLLLFWVLWLVFFSSFFPLTICANRLQLG